MSAASNGEPLQYGHYCVVTDSSGAPVKLGEGAMGVTYLAEDTKLKVKVALKVIRTSLVGDEDVARRFQREARSAARLRHPNVAAVYHLGETRDGFFYAMEFVDGESLQERVNNTGSIPVKQALQICLQLCNALSAAERMSIVHRDIKPANVMLEQVEGEELCAKLIDFGLAKALHSDTDGLGMQTQDGMFVGTPSFSSPEQARNAPLDTRSDFYSIGLTLWYMLEGRPPFEGPFHKVLGDQEHAPPPIDRLAWVPGEVREMILSLLEKDPAHRPQTAREFRQKIHDCLRVVSSSSGEPEWRSRFQIATEPHDQPWGVTYSGHDSLSGAVWLHQLRAELFDGAEGLRRVVAEARRAIDIHHPNVLRHLTVFPCGGKGNDGWIVVTEHPGAQSLLGILRKTGKLPIEEAFSLIECLASALDCCIIHDFPGVDLDPARIYLKASPDKSAGPDAGVVTPKLCPINYGQLAATFGRGGRDAALTQVFVRSQPQTPREAVDRFALLAYECLGGAASGITGRLSRYVPLPLGSQVNAVLRDALVHQTFVTASAFAAALLRDSREPQKASTAASGLPKTSESMVAFSAWHQLVELAAADSSATAAPTIIEPLLRPAPELPATGTGSASSAPR